MAPIRRYLRITKYSVLEVRIYLDRPADADAWLLRRDNPALPRIIQAVRPLVLPKLREENERGKGKGGAKSKKKGVKDVVVEDDFEVSIFLTELSSRHSVLTKQKVLKDKARIRSNSGKLTSWLTGGTSDQPISISEEGTKPIVIREEEEEDDAVNLADIPEAPRGQEYDATGNQNDGDDSTLFIRSTSSEVPAPNKGPSHANGGGDPEDAANDDKKEYGLNTSYDGFSIYGRILCLVVKHRSKTPGGAVASSQQMMEHWVSTQAAADQIDDDEDVG